MNAIDALACRHAEFAAAEPLGGQPSLQQCEVIEQREKCPGRTQVSTPEANDQQRADQGDCHNTPHPGGPAQTA